MAKIQITEGELKGIIMEGIKEILSESYQYWKLTDPNVLNKITNPNDKNAFEKGTYPADLNTLKRRLGKYNITSSEIQQMLNNNSLQMMDTRYYNPQTQSYTTPLANDSNKVQNNINKFGKRNAGNIMTSYQQQIQNQQQEFQNINQQNIANIQNLSNRINALEQTYKQNSKNITVLNAKIQELQNQINMINSKTENKIDNNIAQFKDTVKPLGNNNSNLTPNQV